MTWLVEWIVIFSVLLYFILFHISTGNFVYLKVLVKEVMAFAVPDYMLGGETQAREFVVPADVKENGRLDDYSYSEQQLQHIPEAESILEDNFAQSNGSLQSSMDPVPELLSAPVEEPVGEPQKHTYASIVCTFKSRLIQKVSIAYCFNVGLNLMESRERML